MATARKLTDEEVAHLTRGRGPVDMSLFLIADAVMWRAGGSGSWCCQRGAHC